MNPIRLRLLLGRKARELVLSRNADDRGPALVEPHPQGGGPEAQRESVARAHGARPAPRAAPPASIDIPLETREQTVLGYRLPEEERAQLDGGFAPPGNTGRGS